MKENKSKMKYASGYIIMKGGQQHKAFVCAKTYKRMLELLSGYHVNQHYFNGWWSKCGNDLMKSIACDKEGMWYKPDYQIDVYKKLESWVL